MGPRMMGIAQNAVADDDVANAGDADNSRGYRI